MLVALPGAYVFARYRFPGKSLLRTLATVPFVLPTVVVGTAFLALIGPGGLLGVHLDGTIWAILAAHVFFNYAVVLRTVGGLWSHLDPRLEEAARMLGAGRWRTFTRVTLPLLRPALAAASLPGLPLHLHLLRGDPDPGRGWAPPPSKSRSTGAHRPVSTCPWPRCSP